MDREKYANFRDARMVNLLKVEVNEGDGTAEDPIRRVRYYLDEKGIVLFSLGDEVERKFAGEDPFYEK